MQFLKDPNGDLSSKRLYGIACLIVAIVLAFVKNDAVLTGTFLASASAVFIAQSISKG